MNKENQEKVMIAAFGVMVFGIAIGLIEGTIDPRGEKMNNFVHSAECVLKSGSDALCR